MNAKRPERIRLGLRRYGANVTLKLRWDRSPATCEALVRRLPVEEQVWHAKYAHNEIYVLVEAWQADPAHEWMCAYPGPGDLMYIPHPPGLLPKKTGGPVRLVDLAFFYERGNNLYGPGGPAIGNIAATMTDIEETEKMADACQEVWFSGLKGESMYIEAIG